MKIAVSLWAYFKCNSASHWRNVEGEDPVHVSPGRILVIFGSVGKKDIVNLPF
jgi:hypothetical protein